MRQQTRVSWTLAYVGVLLAACASAPDRSFADAELLIDQSAMLSGWTLDRVRQDIHDEEGQDSGAAAAFSAELPPYLARALETVYRYGSDREAASNFKRLEGTYFNENSFYTTSPWQVPAGFTFSSSVADRWRFGCARSNFSISPQDGAESTRCIYLAQYQEFVVLLTITVEIDGQHFIAMPQLASVIEAIDLKMSEQLGQADEETK